MLYINPYASHSSPGGTKKVANLPQATQLGGGRARSPPRVGCSEPVVFMVASGELPSDLSHCFSAVMACSPEPEMVTESWCLLRALGLAGRHVISHLVRLHALLPPNKTQINHSEGSPQRKWKVSFCS